MKPHLSVAPDHYRRVREPAPGVTVCLGYNGRGVAMATAMRPQLARRVLGGAAAAIDMPVTTLRQIQFLGLGAAPSPPASPMRQSRVPRPVSGAVPPRGRRREPAGPHRTLGTVAVTCATVGSRSWAYRPRCIWRRQARLLALGGAQAPGWGASRRDGGQVIRRLEETTRRRSAAGCPGPRRTHERARRPRQGPVRADRRSTASTATCTAAAGSTRCTRRPQIPEAEPRQQAWQRFGAPVRLLGAAETDALLGTRLCRRLSRSARRRDQSAGAGARLARAACVTARGCSPRRQRLALSAGRTAVSGSTVPPGDLLAEQVLIATARLIPAT